MILHTTTSAFAMYVYKIALYMSSVLGEGGGKLQARYRKFKLLFKLFLCIKSSCLEVTLTPIVVYRPGLHGKM